MFIACPNCETTFSLPDDLYKPGKKARCSQCGKVFPMPDKPEESDIDPMPGIGESIAPPPRPAAPRRARNLRTPLLLGLALVFLLALAYGGWLMFSSSGDEAPQAEGPASPAKEPAADPAAATRDELIKDISLEEIRQFLVENMIAGKIMIIQGLAVNNSPANRDYIAIEARILDANNKTLLQSTQLCGVPLTLFQLQSLSEAELRQSLDNRITILTNNTQVPPGGKVPFVVVFPNPPEGMRTFEVRVVDVRESPPQ